MLSPFHVAKANRFAFIAVNNNNYRNQKTINRYPIIELSLKNVQRNCTFEFKKNKRRNASDAYVVTLIFLGNLFNY